MMTMNRRRRHRFVHGKAVATSTVPPLRAARTVRFGAASADANGTATLDVGQVGDVV